MPLEELLSLLRTLQRLVKAGGGRTLEPGDAVRAAGGGWWLLVVLLELLAAGCCCWGWWVLIVADALDQVALANCLCWVLGK